jgi:hypothetical protein
MVTKQKKVTELQPLVTKFVTVTTLVTYGFWLFEPMQLQSYSFLHALYL